MCNFFALPWVCVDWPESTHTRLLSWLAQLSWGILGEADTKVPPSESFMREIFEEVMAPLKKEANLMAMIHNGLSVVLLLETQISEELNSHLNRRFLGAIMNGKGIFIGSVKHR